MRLQTITTQVSVSAAFLLAAAFPTLAQTPKPGGVYAVVGARIEIGDGRVIEKGTVVIRDGIIESVAVDTKPPADAEVIKGDGLTVYPGFINAYTAKGLTLPDPIPNQDTAPDISAEASPSMRLANRKGVRPELKAADILALTDEILKPERQAGFTTDLIAPGGGTISGTASLVNLNGLTRRDCVLRPEVMIDCSLGSSGGGYPGSAMGIIAFTRQTLLDAQHYHDLVVSYAHGGPERPPDDPTLASLQPLVSGAIPALYTANTEREIRRVAAIADEFKLKLRINGGAEAFKAISLLKSKDIAVVLSLNFGQEPGVTPTPQGNGPVGAGGGPGGRTPGGRRRGGQGGQPGAAPGAAPGGAPTGAPAGAPAGRPANPAPNTPAAPPTTPPAGDGAAPAAVQDDAPPAVIAERHKKWEEKVANAAALEKAGVPFALTTSGVRNQAEFMTNLRKAIKAGLSRAAALQALTLNAAKLFSVDKHLGTVTPGKLAAITVMNGDFADEKSTVQYLFIDRQKFEPGKDVGPIVAAPQRRRPGVDDDSP